MDASLSTIGWCKLQLLEEMKWFLIIRATVDIVVLEECPNNGRQLRRKWLKLWNCAGYVCVDDDLFQLNFSTASFSTTQSPIISSKSACTYISLLVRRREDRIELTRSFTYQSSASRMIKWWRWRSSRRRVNREIEVHSPIFLNLYLQVCRQSVSEIASIVEHKVWNRALKEYVVVNSSIVYTSMMEVSVIRICVLCVSRGTWMLPQCHIRTVHCFALPTQSFRLADSSLTTGWRISHLQVKTYQDF